LAPEKRGHNGWEWITMKATKSTQFTGAWTAIALVICTAFFLVPASALADTGTKLGLHAGSAISVLGSSAALQPAAVRVVRKARIARLAGSLKPATLGNPTAVSKFNTALVKAPDTTPSVDTSTPPTSSDSTPTLMVTHSHPTTEPPVFVRTPKPPHRHRLPYTGGDHTSYLLVGLGVIVLGIAFLGFGSRTKADQIRSDR
jgi:LPXTG-motif cell wall-anchored protein